MDSVTNRYLSQHLPFQELTDFDIGSARERITELMDQHGLVEFWKAIICQNYLIIRIWCYVVITMKVNL